MITILRFLKKLLDLTRIFDFLPLLLMRLFLVPVFWMAGMNKLTHIDNTIAWFANPDWGLGLPYPTLLAYLASITEITGAILLLIGLATRWISIPLMITMLVAILSVHFDNGWLAIAPDHSQMSMKLNAMLNWLASEFPQRHAQLTELGRPVMLQNGVEFAVTYFIMLLTLFFYGAGKYFSLDYWISKKWFTKK